MKKFFYSIPVCSALVLSGCDTAPLVDPALQAQTVAEVATLYERACVQNTGQLSRARTVLNAHGFDNRETVGSAVYYYNDEDDIVAALVPFGFTQTLGGQRQAQTSGIHCAVGSPIYRIDAARGLIDGLAAKYIPDGFSQPIDAGNRDLYSLAINPQVYGKPATWESFIEVVIADEETQAELRAEDPNAPIFALIAGVAVTEISTTQD